MIVICFVMAECGVTFGTGNDTKQICDQFEKYNENDDDDIKEIAREAEKLKKPPKCAEDKVSLAYMFLAHRSKDTQEKERLYLKAIDYGFTEAYLDLFDMFEKQDESKAISYLKIYVSMQPKDYRAYHYLGDFELEKRNHLEAYKWIQKALNQMRRENQEKPGVIYNVFKINYIMGNYEEADKMLGFYLLAWGGEYSIESLRELEATDDRFKGMSQHKLFKKYFTKEFYVQ